jgi:hypothetical protein
MASDLVRGLMDLELPKERFEIVLADCNDITLGLLLVQASLHVGTSPIRVG